ncbi:DoxX family protein [Risungbinella massiliensis]|uniref:DoxX family protein n=1 Tax=Risungbinella massiliensis TaxID=1329796 RepID=UPI0005CC3224|nr:DoxX family protein [Risungbinella massiliensis]
MNQWLKIAKWIGLILITLIFLQAGVLKLAGEPRTVAGFHQLGFPEWFRLMIGLFEIIGGIALLLRTSSRYGAILLSSIMIGAIITTLVLGQVWEVIIPSVMFCILVLIGIKRKPFRRFTRTEKKVNQDYTGV